VGHRFFSFDAMEMFSIALELARRNNSNGIDHAVIAPKPMELPPNMEMGGERLS
jgi:hypothetical protein